MESVGIKQAKEEALHCKRRAAGSGETTAQEPQVKVKRRAGAAPAAGWLLGACAALLARSASYPARQWPPAWSRLQLIIAAGAAIG